MGYAWGIPAIPRLFFRWKRVGVGVGTGAGAGAGIDMNFEVYMLFPWLSRRETRNKMESAEPPRPARSRRMSWHLLLLTASLQPFNNVTPDQSLITWS